jgi:hypothetical protein
VRFTPKYPGDMSVEDWLEQKYPNWDTVRFCHQLDNATSVGLAPFTLCTSMPDLSGLYLG